MNQVSQHNILGSVEQSLTGTQNLVDGRTEQDWLHFIAQYAALINFYDQQNQHHGNWQPFVLKDPVILLATISKTNYTSYEKEYRYICTNLNRLVQRNEAALGGESINNLFNFLTSVFLRIGEWVYYMQLTHEPYPLRENVLRQVIQQFGPAFRAMCSLRQNLFLSHSIKGIEAVNHKDLQLFNAGQHTRLQPKNPQPYWELLELQYPLKNNSPEQLVQVLMKLGNELMLFFNSIISHAQNEFVQLSGRRSPFPDTLLLRAFVRQLDVYKQQFNGLTEKHLWFNYKNILRLEEKPGVADSAYLCATLTQKDQVFVLPAGTLFDAGTDANKEPVTFTNNEPAYLNPATMATVYTISTIKGNDERYRIYRQNIPAPSVVQKNEAGNILSWNSFGGTLNPTAVQQKQGVLFASPMLLLREGERRITVTFRFAVPVPASSMGDVQYYLSTQKNWLPVNAMSVAPNEQAGNEQVNSFSVLLVLTDDQPPIEAFAQLPNGLGPNGLPTNWPMLKLEFSSFADTATPPVITSLKIEVIVRGVKTLELYNDFGALTVSSPFQPLGPTPLPGSNFIIGSNEVFSKPLNMLQMQLVFDKPPADLAAYYNEYNQYLYRKAEAAQPPDEKKS
ncbi:MAG: hypothetical protein JNM68_05515, partial [Dinghuibacter sp.]|nr:hypothetical protein [Dinghuibacter sp.]